MEEKKGITKKYNAGQLVEDKTSKKAVVFAASHDVTKLIYIDCEFKNETEKLFIDISNFKKLECLTIQRCSLQEFNPSKLSKEIEEINLESNLLSDLKSIEFSSKDPDTKA